MEELSPGLEIPHVVLQPTKFCNIDCQYCYLGSTSQKGVMSPEISTAIAASLQHVHGSRPTTIVWHAGEPLTTGLVHFEQLLEPFEDLRRSGRIHHSVQTNATLINNEWCALFSQYGFRVGVSIDGDRKANRRRIDRKQRETYDATMRGIAFLKKHGIRFSVIAVVHEANVDDPAGFYRFFRELGCAHLGINVDEKEGPNANSPVIDVERVRAFWDGLWRAWATDPQLKIRELEKTISWIAGEAPAVHADIRFRDYWPTVSLDGNVVVASPELAEARPEDLKRLVIGNVLTEPLHEMLNRAHDVWYIKEVIDGVKKCRATCPYYGYCTGGHSSNRYFEHGRFDVTETLQCIHHEQLVIDTALRVFEEMEGSVGTV